MPCLSMWFITIILISLFVCHVPFYGVHTNPISAHSDCQRLFRCLKLCLFQNVEDFEKCEKLGKIFFPHTVGGCKTFQTSFILSHRPQTSIPTYYTNSTTVIRCTFIFCTQTMQPKKRCKSLHLMFTLETPKWMSVYAFLQMFLSSQMLEGF